MVLIAAVVLASGICAAVTPSTLAARPTCLVSNDATGVGYRDLNAALAAAAPGATLTLKGTCTAWDVPATDMADYMLWRDVTLKGVANRAFGVPTLRGTGDRDVVYVLPGVTVTLIGLTITNGNANQPDSVSMGSGGGIENDGTATLIDSDVTGNFGWCAGALGNYFRATMTILHSTVRGNTSQAAGGAIYNSGTLTIANSVISDNTSEHGSAGGIINWRLDTVANSGYLTMTDSTISDNGAAQSGGGILNDGTINGTAVMTLTNTEVSGNTANYGGGVANRGVAWVSGSRIEGNAAVLAGGGIENEGNLALQDSSIADNTAQRGGGYAALAASGTVELRGTTSISSNAASVSGGGMFGTLAVTLTGWNGSVSDNTPDDCYPGVTVGSWVCD